MDEAEAWLSEHDPAYASTSEGWKHVKTGEYKAPWQEVAIGLYRDGDTPVETPGSRICGACYEPFAPADGGQVYCSNRCKERMKKRRQRDRKCPPPNQA